MPFSKVIIDKEVLDLNSPASAGLVSGLKKLSDKQAILCVNNYDDVDGALRRIIDLENIKINQNSVETPARNYIIRKDIKQNTLIILD
ncbi:MAG TPA: hypothetical protein VHP30_11275, partial [Ignavibacteriales bacterium]|nr:hypothetical protein [Ignavibacteriales bacterium]